jgi:long-subunit acyl-CoA synthetase (AMP-forming)
VGPALADLQAAGHPDDPYLNSVGRPGGPFLEVAIVDENGNRLAPRQVGDMVVHSAISVGEYWGLPARTAEAFFPGDWFRPYDVGYLEEDDFLYYADRAGDKITSPPAPPSPT